MTNSFGTYLATLIRFVFWKIALSLALMVSVSLTEGVGLLLLVPFLQLVGLNTQQGGLGRLTEGVAWGFSSLGIRPTLEAVLAVYISIMFCNALLKRWQAYTNLAAQQEFMAILRRRLYRAIVNAGWLFLARSRSSDFAHALTSQIDRIGMATECLLYLIVEAILASVYLLVALEVSGTVTGLALACGVLLLLLLRKKTEAVQQAGEETTRVTQNLYAATIEHLGTLKTAKSYAAEERHTYIFSRLAHEMAHINVESGRQLTVTQFWFSLGVMLLLGLILYVSLAILAVPTAAVLLLIFLFGRIMPRFANLLQNYQHLANLLPAFASAMAMLQRCEGAAEHRMEGAPQSASHPPALLQREIRLEKVHFGYEPDGQVPVIRDLDLSVRSGQTTAIVGPSGAGKSTIADLILGLIAPDRGLVTVDGIPLTPERLRSWRERIGYVAQDTFLFHDTVRANLLWALPDAGDEALRQALRLTAAEDFVAGLPQGMETVIGDRGVRLSGGERQRLALARALLRQPSLLILDEATSALDSENEKRIQNAIEELHGEMTILIITHRLSTVGKADVIHVLEQGRLIESGNWDTLMARADGRFRTLCRAQGIDRS